MAMRPCQCGNRSPRGWKYNFNDDTRKIRAVCKKCGLIVEFSAKPRKPLDPNKVEACAEYEIRDGVRFLKIDGEFVEVEIVRFDKKNRVSPTGCYMRVMPVIN
jgi:hypothetical protein